MKEKPENTHKDGYSYLRKFSYVSAIVLIVYSCCRAYYMHRTYDDRAASSDKQNWYSAVKDAYGVLRMVLKMKKDGTLKKLADANGVSVGDENDKIVVVRRNEIIREDVPLFCGQKVSVQVTDYRKNDKVGDKWSKSFILGADPTIPALLTAGIARLNLGDEARIIINQKSNKDKPVSFYDVQVVQVEAMPKIRNFQLVLGKQGFGPPPLCGSLVQVCYTVSDINGNLLLKNNTVEFVIGFGQAPAIIERAVMQSSAGGNLKIIASRDAFLGFDFYRNSEVKIDEQWFQGLAIPQGHALVMNVEIKQVTN